MDAYDRERVNAFVSAGLAEYDQATAYDRAIAYARERGEQDGRNAAGWYSPFYRDDTNHARRILRGIEDGDPAILTEFPQPDLSGQWADSLTGPELVADALSDAGVNIDSADGERHSDKYVDWFSDICDAYETAFSQAVEDEIARVARDVLA